MNIASIDIGTNTILLLIANVDLKAKKLKTLHEEIRIPRIGSELHQLGKISTQKIDELEKILLEYKKIAEFYNCSETLIIGTHAFRIASNSKEIQSHILERTSFSIEIISPELEAEYAFYGIKGTCAVDGIFGIVDIGGGSTEIIIGNEDSVINKISFPIGVVTLKDECIHGYPISESDDTNLKMKIRSVFENLDLGKHAPNILIGISGTPTTLSAIKNDLRTFDPHVIEKTTLRRNEISGILEVLKKLSAERILETYGEIISKREDILYIGGIILLNIMDYLNLTNLIVSTYGIRHGVIYKNIIEKK